MDEETRKMLMAANEERIKKRKPRRPFQSNETSCDIPQKPDWGTSIKPSLSRMAALAKYYDQMCCPYLRKEVKFVSKYHFPHYTNEPIHQRLKDTSKDFQTINMFQTWDNFLDAHPFDEKRCTRPSVMDQIKAEMLSRDHRCIDQEGQGSLYDFHTKTIKETDFASIDDFNAKHPYNAKLCFMNEKKMRENMQTHNLDFIKECKRHDESFDTYDMPSDKNYRNPTEFFNDPKNKFSIDRCKASNASLQLLISKHIESYKRRCARIQYNLPEYAYRSVNDPLSTYGSFNKFKVLEDFNPKNCVVDEAMVKAACKDQTRAYGKTCVDINEFNDATYPEYCNTVANGLAFLQTPHEPKRCVFSHEKLLNAINAELSLFGNRCKNIVGGRYSNEYTFLPKLTAAYLRDNNITTVDGFKLKHRFDERNCVVSQDFKNECAKQVDDYKERCFNEGPYKKAYKYTASANPEKLPSFAIENCTVDKERIRKITDKHYKSLLVKCEQSKQGCYTADMYKEDSNARRNIDSIDGLTTYLNTEFDHRRCEIDKNRVDTEISNVLASYAQTCVDNDPTMASYYEQFHPNISDGYTTVDSFKISHPFEIDKCKIDASKLRAVLVKEIEERKKMCSRHPDQIYSENYKFSLPNDTEIVKYKSKQFFNDSPRTRFDVKLCSVDPSKIRLRIQNSLGEKASKCRKRTDGNFSGYVDKGPIPEEMTHDSLIRFEAEFDMSKCTVDHRLVSIEIDKVIAEYAKDCLGRGKADDYPPASDKEKDMFTSASAFRASNAFNVDNCEIDEAKLADELRLELIERGAKCANHSDGIYSTAYAFELDLGKLKEYKSREIFNEGISTRFDTRCCQIDVSKVEQRIRAQMGKNAQRCLDQKDGTFLKDYHKDARPPSSCTLSELIKFETTGFDPKYCALNAKAIEQNIDDVLKDWRKECVRRNPYNSGKYIRSSADLSRKYTSQKEFNDSNRFEESRCEFDASRLHKDLLSELESRKEECSKRNKKDGAVNKRDYSFADEFTIPSVNDVDALKHIRSLDEFNKSRQYNELNCVLDDKYLLEQIDKEIDERKQQCADSKEAMFVRDYDFKVGRDTILKSRTLQNFKRSYGFDSHLCRIDKVGIASAIDKELLARSAYCKKWGYADKYRAAIAPSDIRSLTDYNTRNETKYNEVNCDVDVDRFKSDVKTEVALRNDECKALGFLGTKLVPEIGDAEIKDVKTINRYRQKYPNSQDDCVVDAARIQNEIKLVNENRDQRCKFAGYKGYTPKPAFTGRLWRQPGEYKEKSGPLNEDTEDADCTIDNETDKHSRYYKYSPTRSSCTKLKGTWNKDDINRRTGKKGQCWSTFDDALCGANLSPNVMANHATSSESVQDKRDCEQHKNKCEWTQMTIHPDCVTTSLIDKQAQKLDAEVRPVLDPANQEDRIFKHFSEMKVPTYMDVDGKPGVSRCGPIQTSSVKNSSVGGEISNLYNAPPENDFLPNQGKPKSMFTLPQSVVRFAMRDIALRGANEPGNRGLLVWHSTGSGKLFCGAACMEAFWDTNLNIVFASTIQNNAANPPEKYIEALLRFFPRFANRSLTDKQNYDKMEDLYKRRGIVHLSFATLSHQLKGSTEKKININKSIIIIDEIQNLFYPISGQNKEHDDLKRMLIDTNYSHSMKIVLLTATPGDNAKDAMQLLNIVRDPRKPLIRAPENATDMQNFKRDIRGLISYFEGSGDLSQFPRLEEHTHYYNMSESQYSLYTQDYDDFDKGKINKNYAQLVDEMKPALYWEKVRKISNMPYAKLQLPAGSPKLQEYSAKLYGLLGVLQSVPHEKHFVYSAFFKKLGSSQGVRMIADVLSSEMGYAKLSPGRCREMYDGLLRGEKFESKKRYVLCTNRDLSENKAVGETAQNLGYFLKLFNSPENINGDLIHVFIASQKYNESNDFHAIRHIHIFEPLLSMVAYLQTIGRGRRHCSHSNLPLSDWVVHVHRYFSAAPNSITIQVLDVRAINDEIAAKLEEKKVIESSKKRPKSALAKLDAIIKKLRDSLTKQQDSDKRLTSPMIDQTIFEEAVSRMKLLELTLRVMKEAAIDCRLLQRFHNVNLNAENKLVCTDWKTT